MLKLAEVRALDGYRLWLRYEDGVEGEIDLSDLAGRGVFEAWNDRSFFEAVRLGETGAPVWGSDIELCPDALYLKLTGKGPEDIFPRLKTIEVHA